MTNQYYMLNNDVRSSDAKATRGPYDQHYREMGIVWNGSPGRMVRRASELLPAGRALDAGCGDGKDTLFLSRLGWAVTAFDISSDALHSFDARLAMSGQTVVPVPFLGDASAIEHETDSFDCVIAYGLYHCLSDVDLARAHANLARALKPGGLFVVAAFNDELPLPSKHATPNIVLRPRDHLFDLCRGWKVEAREFGRIVEHHLPVVDMHEHSMTWAILRKLTA